jgi:hypothetical protein
MAITQRELKEITSRSFEDGIDVVDEALPETARTLLPVPVLEAVKTPPAFETLKRTAEAHTASQITRIGDDTLRSIDGLLARGALGDIPTQQLFSEIGSNLNESLVFKSVAQRGEVIARTEVNRIYSIANDARMQQAKTVIPGLGKEWVWSGRSRQSHAAAEGQIVPVDQSFEVGGEQLKYPRDPAGSAKNTVRCGCASVPFVPEEAQKLPAVSGRPPTAPLTPPKPPRTFRAFDNEVDIASWARSQADEGGLKMWNKVRSDLPQPASAKQLESLAWYKRNGYRAVNKRLRGINPGKRSVSGPGDTILSPDKARYNEVIDDTIKNIDDFIKTQTLDEDVLAWRSVGRDALDDLELAVGDVFSDAAYTSSSLNGEFAQGWADTIAGEVEHILVKIKIPKGQKAAWMETRAGGPEAELLLPRDTSFRVNSISKQRVGRSSTNLKTGEVVPAPERTILEVEIV